MNYENIDAPKFAELMQLEDHVVLDVRSPQELAEGEIPGHQMINMFEPDFMERIEALDKTQSFLIYCRSGNRSGQACAAMSQMGFGELYNLEGGIGAWNNYKAGL